MWGECRRRSAVVVSVVVTAAVTAGVAGSVTAGAQIPPLAPSPTTATTAATPAPGPSPGGEPVAQPASGDSAPAEPQPAPPQPLPEDRGEGLDHTGGRAIPASARAVIDSIARTAPNNNSALVEGVAALEAAGVAHEQAVHAVFGGFPVLGPARWVDDWYFPRWTGTTFRHHLGLDMFAEYGTPVVAPVDGHARIANNALGGLTVRVVQPDGTYWYLAHLSGIAEGIVDGTRVIAGQIVGFVGDSGNARGGAPHLHLGIYVAGAEPVPPKPVVDGLVADGAARIVELLAVAAAPQPAAAVPPAAGADPAQQGAEQRSLDLAWSQAVDRSWQVLGPMVNPTLRRAIEARQAA